MEPSCDPVCKSAVESLAITSVAYDILSNPLNRIARTSTSKISRNLISCGSTASPRLELKLVAGTLAVVSVEYVTLSTNDFAGANPWQQNILHLKSLFPKVHILLQINFHQVKMLSYHLNNPTYPLLSLN